MSKKIGIVINVDTRPGYLDNHAFCGMGGGGGCRSVDFMTDNVLNKIKFFRNYDIEVTLYVHLIQDLTYGLLAEIKDMIDQGFIHNFVINRDTKIFMGKDIRQWQDTMYLNALMLSRGEYIAHFDADSAAFRRDDSDIIDRMVAWIDSGRYDFVSYPSVHSPHEGPEQCLSGDPEYLWASSRFFFCRRDFIDYDEIVRCFDDNYWIARHSGKPHRYPNVIEQILGHLAGKDRVLYPPKNNKDAMIFCWHNYFDGIAGWLNEASYEDVYDYVMNKCGGINGPCDVNGVCVD